MQRHIANALAHMHTLDMPYAKAPQLWKVRECVCLVALTHIMPKYLTAS